MGTAIGLGTGPDRAVWSALPRAITTASATFVGDTPGMVGYGGNVIVGRAGVVGASAMAIRALGAAVGSSVAFAAVSTGALSSAASSVCAAVSVPASGV